MFFVVYINKNVRKKVFIFYFIRVKMRDDQSKWLSIEVVIDAEQTSTI